MRSAHSALRWGSALMLRGEISCRQCSCVAADPGSPAPWPPPTSTQPPNLHACAGSQELYDVLAQRDIDQEAFCAVCGDGHSGARCVGALPFAAGGLGLLSLVGRVVPAQNDTLRAWPAGAQLLAHSQTAVPHCARRPQRRLIRLCSVSGATWRCTSTATASPRCPTASGSASRAASTKRRNWRRVYHR